MKVLVTRARDGAGRLVEKLRDDGFEVVERPLVRVEAVDGPPIRTDGYEWVVLTSRIAAEELFRRLDGPLSPVAVVGPGTAEALRAHGVEPAVVAHESTQEGLAAALPRPAGRVLFCGAEGARDVLVRELDADFVPLYRTIEDPPDELPDVDLVVLASPSAARALAAVRTDLPCVSIGPVTTAEAERSGLRVVREAERHDLEGLVAAVKLAASAITSSRS